MKAAEFQRKIRSSDHPVIVDLWAPWCRPCRAMEPGFKQISDKYAGQVEVLKINADESPEVLKSLGVMGIPTVIGFAGGKEIIRRTGMQAPDALDVIFDSTLHQRRPAVMPPAPIHRILRTIAGFFLLTFGWFSGQSVLLMVLGAIVLFSAFYDRCPVYRAVAAKVKELLSNNPDRDSAPGE